MGGVGTDSLRTSGSPSMHSLVRRYIKTAVGFLVVGLGLGGWMIVQRELIRQYPSAYEISAHTHAIFV